MISSDMKTIVVSVAWQHTAKNTVVSVSGNPGPTAYDIGCEEIPLSLTVSPTKKEVSKEHGCCMAMLASCGNRDAEKLERYRLSTDF
jgi:hypothetical protein